MRKQQNVRFDFNLLHRAYDFTYNLIRKINSIFRTFGTFYSICTKTLKEQK